MNFIMINPLLMIFLKIHAVYSLTGGSPTQLGEFSYIVSIQDRHQHYCSGIIIHEKHIITVAHRIANIPISELRVAFGRNIPSDRWAERYSIKEVFLHPGFQIRDFLVRWDNAYYENDIAVLRLEQSFVWSPIVSKASLLDIDYDWGYHLDCTLVSWDVSDEAIQVISLSWELIKLMDHEMYAAWHRYLGKDQKFFTDYFGTAIIGMEDLGSPLVCGNLVNGLVVKGEQSAIPGLPAIVMSIAPYSEYINDIIHDGLFEVVPEEFPYVVAIWYNGIYTCGGFIIDAIHVATAGQCVAAYNIGSFEVSVGSPPQFFTLIDVAVHPNYKVETIESSPNWFIEHDYALLTLSESILWNQMTSPLLLAQSDGIYEGKFCKVLRWKHLENGRIGLDSIKLMASRVIILNNECSPLQLDPNTQSRAPSFWGKSQYLTPIADDRDAGNPIICDGNPVGFLSQVIRFNGRSTAAVAKFLKILPYIGMSYNS